MFGPILVARPTEYGDPAVRDNCRDRVSRALQATHPRAAGDLKKKSQGSNAKGGSC